ncbi:hypothetical protein BDA96_03G471300 [Sorghum bicolor]|uniref:Uncharacterized protein n=1 Tax=Sorghum bicolor TaxID=4558 RepID=A0A921RLP4_SORBI|nr:hypothetical protein BDA96_03G471300 [Sorghum bicolor]
MPIRSPHAGGPPLLFLNRRSASDPLLMYSYTSSRWAPSWQNPSSRTRFRWLVRPMARTSRWNSTSPSSTIFSSRFTAIAFSPPLCGSVPRNTVPNAPRPSGSRKLHVACSSSW